MNWDIPQILQLAGAAIIGLLVVLYKYHENRLTALENTRQSREEAGHQGDGLRADLDDHAKRDDEQFQAVQTSIRDTRVEMREAFTSFRNEANEKRTEMRNDMLNLRAENTAAFARIYDLIERKSATRKR